MQQDLAFTDGSYFTAQRGGTGSWDVACGAGRGGERDEGVAGAGVRFKVEGSYFSLNFNLSFKIEGSYFFKLYLSCTQSIPTSKKPAYKNPGCVLAAPLSMLQPSWREPKHAPLRMQG